MTNATAPIEAPSPTHRARETASPEAEPPPAVTEDIPLADVTVCLTVRARMDRFDGPDDVATYLIELVRLGASAQAGFIVAVGAEPRGTVARAS